MWRVCAMRGQLKIKVEEDSIAARPDCHRRFHLVTFQLRRELKIKLEEDRKRLVEAINTTFGNLVSSLAAR